MPVGTAAFPAALDTASTLIEVHDGAITTLADPAVNATDTTFNSPDTSTFPSTGFFVIEGEVVTFTGKTSTSFTGCARAQFTALGGLAASPHPAGAIIQQLTIAALHKALADAIVAAETKVGSGASTATSGKVLTGTGAGTSAWSDPATPTDAELAAIAGLVSAADRLPYFTGSGTAALATFTAAGRALVDDADAAAQRTTLGLVIGTDVQAFDAELAALAGLTSAADRLPYFTGSGAAALATFTAAGRALIDDANAAAQIATLGLDADIATLSLPASTTISAYGATVVDDGDAATARTTLGLVIGTNVQAWDADLDAFAALAKTDGMIPQADGSTWQLVRQVPMYVPFLTLQSGGGATVWTNMPLAQTELMGSTVNRARVDLTNARQFRLNAEVIGAGSTNATLDIQYSTNISTPSFTSYSSLVAIATTGWKSNGWVTLPAGSRTDVVLRIVGAGGDGVADPNFANITAEFR